MLINTYDSKNNSIAPSINDIPNYINYKALAYCIVGKKTYGNVRTAVNADKLIKKTYHYAEKGRGITMNILEQASELREIAEHIATKRGITVQEAWPEALEELKVINSSKESIY